MSFDLAVWLPRETPTPVAEATWYYHELCDRPMASFIPGEAMAGLVAEVQAHLERTVGAHVDGVWSVAPSVGADCALLAMPWPCADEARAFVPGLAVARGYVCFDPQTGVLYDSEPVDRAPMLKLADGSWIREPDDEQIERAVFKLSRERWFANLGFGDEDRYFQVGYGDAAGVPAGQYAVEYRAADGHWRAVTSDRGAIARTMSDYRDGKERWEKRFSWRRLTDLS